MNKYFNEIGFTSRPDTSLETLKELHRLHTLRFPFEDITPFLHQEVKLDIDNITRKFLDDKRGGYCFEQNLLFSSVLKFIGFNVKHLGARVLWNQPEDLITRKSHMLLLVEIDGVQYLADVGFGGLTLTTPLKFELNIEQETTHEKFRIGQLGKDLKLQVFVGTEWKTIYRFDLEEQYLVDYEVANFYLCHNETSIFRNTLIGARVVSNGRYALSNNQLTFYVLDGTPERKILKSIDEVKDVLVKTLGINLPVHPDLNARIETVLKRN